MGTGTTFRDEQRRLAARFRGDLPIGRWKTPEGTWIPVPWIVAPEHADVTLWAPIRESMKTRFADEDIAWHEQDSNWYGHQGGPSPNLMDSQIVCLNFWFGVDALAAVQQLLPDAASVDALEPEWIGRRNYLGERGSKRARGRFATSADLLIRVTDAQGSRHGLLIESKWSESYTTRSLRFSRNGTDRAGIYRTSYEHPDSPFLGGAPEDHMVDPFDQLMRTQLLAAEMEREKEDGLETVTVVVAAPRANRAIWQPLMEADWAQHLRQPDRFRLAAYEDLVQAGGQPGWADYLRGRYALCSAAG